MGGYLIGPNDSLRISVWKDESLTADILVPPDQIISFPLIGDVPVKGLTVSQLKDVITQKISEYVPGASVTVMLVQPNSLVAYAIGKVNSPGRFPIGLNTSVMQLLAMAGGLNPYAASDKILILRQEGEKTVKIPFDYNQVKKGKDLEQNIIIHRGDVIVVP
jgi:polysaccharide export outer membrane protein